MPEIQTKDKLITLEELGAAINAKAGVTSVNSQTGAVSLTPAGIGAVAKTGDTMTGPLSITPPSGGGGEIALGAPGDDDTKNGITIDNFYGKFRIFGIPSKDATTHTNYGIALTYDPYAGVLHSENGDITASIGRLYLSNPLHPIYGGTGATTRAGAIANLGALAKSELPLDLNNATAEELQTGYNAYTNSPAQTGGFAVSIPMGQSARLQFWIAYNDSKIYMRAYNGLSWTSWKVFT